MSLAVQSPLAVTPKANTRWIQLAAGLVCMMAISSPQYVWTLFTKPFIGALGVSLASVQTTFSILIVLQTFLSPFQAALIERFGPRLLISCGCALTGLSWVVASRIDSLAGLYLSYGVLGGIGTGIVYVGVVGLMVRWFPERRGFAAGMVAAGYGMGAMVTTFPVSTSIERDGFQATLLTFGAIFGVVGLVAAQFLRAPPNASVSAAALVPARRAIGTTEMLRTPIFWLMFFMMSVMSTSGLMVTSQLSAFARDFGVAQTVLLGMGAVPLALTLDRFTNGLTRPLFGFLSDRIGRETTMAIAFAFEGLAMLAWLSTLSQPIWFVILSGVVFFGWGEIFSLFPSTLTDTFGDKHATTNYGCLYMAQGVGSILGGPLAALLKTSAGSWTPVFAIAIAGDLLVALLAVAVLKGMRRRYLSRGSNA